MRVKAVLLVLLVLVLSVCMLASAQAHEVKWKTPGANPNVLGVSDSFRRLGFENTHRWETQMRLNFDLARYVTVTKGDYFKAMNFGDGEVWHDVVADFEYTTARKWKFPVVAQAEIYSFDACNNMAFNITYQPLDGSPIEKMIGRKGQQDSCRCDRRCDYHPQRKRQSSLSRMALVRHHSGPDPCDYRPSPPWPSRRSGSTRQAGSCG